MSCSKHCSIPWAGKSDALWAKSSDCYRRRVNRLLHRGSLSSWKHAGIHDEMAQICLGHAFSRLFCAKKMFKGNFPQGIGLRRAHLASDYLVALFSAQVMLRECSDPIGWLSHVEIELSRHVVLSHSTRCQGIPSEDCGNQRKSLWMKKTFLFR